MRFLKKLLKVLIIIILAFSAIVYLFMQQKSFGKLPSGKRLERIKSSPNFKEGSFQNIIETPMIAPDASYTKMMTNFFFSKAPNREPSKILPSIRTNLKDLSDAPTLTWFGHSSYLISIEGKKILVDPIFSAYASPVQYFGSKNYPVTNPYSVDDFPNIDVIVISHDHYDHLDYNTVLKLKDRTKLFCVPLGIGSHLEHWGVDPAKIIEFDWWQTDNVMPGFELTSTPARHFSGRGFKRGQTLWSSYVLKTNKFKIFIGGDSGYDESFKKIGEKYGPFDIVMLECGQYDKQWPYIHMMPEQTVQASLDLNANVLLPVHWAKFTLALHPWDDSINRAVKEAERINAKLTTPEIGERFRLDSIPAGTKWWRDSL